MLGSWMFIVLLPLRFAAVAVEAEDAADHQPDDAGDHEARRIGEEPADGCLCSLRPDDSLGAADGGDPAEEGNEDAPVADPHIMIEQDRDAGADGKEAGEIDQGRAAQALLSDPAEDGAVYQDADGDGDEDGPEQPCEKQRDSRGSDCCHVLSLRRHDPDQVQRVPAVSIGGSLSSLTGAPLGTPVNVGRPGRVSTHCRAPRGQARLDLGVDSSTRSHSLFEASWMKGSSLAASLIPPGW